MDQKLDFRDFTEVDYDVLAECLFKDAKKFGEAELAETMAHFQLTLFYVGNGLSVPDGPLPWGDFE